MTNLEEYLYNKVLPVIQSWNEKGIYAISFFVHYDECYEYKGFKKLTRFSIGYNTEAGCNNADPLSAERWDFAFWKGDMTDIINPDNDKDEGLKVLFDWYKENKIYNIGFEEHVNAFDRNMNYIGKGPVGYYELLVVVSNVAKRLQLERKISKLFGKIPIIVHDSDYPWYVKEATKNANPGGEAGVFLKAFEKGFFHPPEEKVKCPYCGQEMISGEIYGGGHVMQWMPDSQQLIVGIRKCNCITIGEETRVFGSYRARAYVCLDCEKLIHDLVLEI